MKIKWSSSFLLGSALLLWSACDTGQRETLVRPHMYPRIDLPEGTAVALKEAECPFDASIPSYTTVVQKDMKDEDEVSHDCWFNLVFPDLGATLHCTYFPIDKEEELSSLIEDAYTMASKHNVKASFREEHEIANRHNASGVIFSIEGEVASPYQFYISDKKRHFLRGSLYFDNKVNQDSIAPVVSFLKRDVDAFLASIDFK